VLRRGILDAVGSFKQISVVRAERENDAIIDLRTVLETKPTIPKIVTAYAKIDGLYRPGGQQFVHLSLGDGRQSLVGRYAEPVCIRIADKCVAAKAFDPKTWTPVASPRYDTHRLIRSTTCHITLTRS
jgi:hypothetical protein